MTSASHLAREALSRRRAAIRNMSAREAGRLARSLGWTAAPRRQSGEIEFLRPDGKRFFTGRSRIPSVLARALAESEATVEPPTPSKETA